MSAIHTNMIEKSAQVGLKDLYQSIPWPLSAYPKNVQYL